MRWMFFRIVLEIVLEKTLPMNHANYLYACVHSWLANAIELCTMQMHKHVRVTSPSVQYKKARCVHILPTKVFVGRVCCFE